MRNILQYIDFQRLSGITSILGVDVMEQKACVVILKRKGNPFQRFLGKFSLVDSFSVLFDPVMSVEQRALYLRESLESRKVKTRYAVSSVRSMGIKTVTATIPANVENIEEWIREQQEKLLRLPVPPDQVSFQYEILGRNAEGASIEITFIRNSDIEEYKSFFAQAGLQLLALGAGVRDIINPVLVDSQLFNHGNIHVIHSEEKTLSIASLQEGKRMPLKFVSSIDQYSVSSIISELKKENDSTRLLITGDRLEPLEGERDEFYRPFGIFPEYTLAAGLAIKGFIPGLSPINYLPQEEQEKISVQIYRSLFQRAALVLGSITIILLGMQFLTSIILQKMIGKLDDEMISSSVVYAEVMSLEQQVKDLENKIRSDGFSLRRTIKAKVLYEVASLTPDGVRLDRLSIDGKEASQQKLLLSGIANTHESIADYLRKLEASGLCYDAKLVRTGVGGQQDQFEQILDNGRDNIRFEITALLR
ncbi:MAG: PilN domain-containing protein [Bacteroidota bacterium]